MAELRPLAEEPAVREVATAPPPQAGDATNTSVEHDARASDDEQDFIRRSLADLDAERAAGDIDERDYEELRAAYIARSHRQQARSATPGARKNRRAPYVIFGAIAGVGILVGVLLAHNAGTRLPGDNITGQTPTSPAAKLDAEAQQQIQAS